MSRQFLAVLLAIAVGVAAGVLLVAESGPEAPPRRDIGTAAPVSVAEQLFPPDASEDLDRERLTQVLESLALTLDEEIAERRVLAEQLEGLQAEVADLKQNLRARVREAFAQDERSARAQADGRAAQTMEERLTAAGFTSLQLAAIERLRSEAQMAQIDLDDRARREGWSGARYQQELASVANGSTKIREMLGDASYDRYLFASGQPNRVTVQSVIGTSPADRAGLRAGDTIVSYAGESVFSTPELVTLRSSGERGAPVTIEILRDGQLMQISVPRGPIGVNLRNDIVDPSSPGNR